MNFIKKFLPALAIVFVLPSVTFAGWLSNVYQPSYRTYRFGSYGSGYGGGGFWGVMSLAMNILSQLVIIIISFAVVFFMFGVLKYITAGSDTDKLKEGKNYMIYGVIGLFVMVSFWGIVNILINTFELDNTPYIEAPYFQEGGYYGDDTNNYNNNSGNIGTTGTRSTTDD